MTALPTSTTVDHTLLWKMRSTKDDVEKEIIQKCGQQVSGTAGGGWRRQHKTELDGDK